MASSPTIETTKIEQAILRAARRLVAAPPCKVGSWASKCERCKAKAALRRAIDKLA